MTRAYGLDNPSLADLSRIAEAWRPYRTWVAFLFRARREADTGEIRLGRTSPRPR